MGKLAALRKRPTWVWLHRWAGLVMASFLVIAGGTGGLLAFYDELDALLNPHLQSVAPPDDTTPMLDAVTLLERALAARPNVVADSAIAAYRPDKPLVLYVEPRDPLGPKVDDELYVDPYTGEVLGSRHWGDISQGLTNLMPFLHEVHYALALGDFGIWVFGIVAVLWTLDCFVGVYLTLPRGRPFLAKWRIAWLLQRKRLNFDLHRAGGLWTWAMLFVLAWSSVALNLADQVYRPVMGTVFSFAAPSALPARPSQLEPGLSWRAAYARGHELIRSATRERGIDAFREDALRYDHSRTEFTYWVATKLRTNGEAYDWLGVTFDADTGASLRINDEDVGTTRERSGDFVTRWLIDLHMANVGGLPFRIFVCAMGVVVSMLSVTGIVIWWRKRRARRHSPLP